MASLKGGQAMESAYLGRRAVIYHFPPTYHFDQKMKRVGTKRKKILRFPVASRGKALHRQIADPFITPAQRSFQGYYAWAIVG